MIINANTSFESTSLNFIQRATFFVTRNIDLSSKHKKPEQRRA